MGRCWKRTCLSLGLLHHLAAFFIARRRPAWRVVLGCLMPRLGVHALPLQVVRSLAATNDPGVAERGVAEHSLAVEGLLGSFFLRAWAPDAVGHAAELRALVLGRRLGAEVAEVEVLLELCRPWLAEGKAESGTVQRSLLRRG